MKKQYTQPQLEMKKLVSMQTVAASGDNDFDVESDTDWGDFG